MVYKRSDDSLIIHEGAHTKTITIEMLRLKKEKHHGNLAEPDHAFSVEEEKALIALCETTDNSITPPGGDSRKTRFYKKEQSLKFEGNKKFGI